MTRAYWDKIADDYEAEIFDVQKQDRAGLVLGYIRKYGSRVHRATDLGCGIGRFLAPLSRGFQEVLALDIAPKCIARAQVECSHLSNVTYLRMDLAAPRARLPKADFALSVNSLLTPSLPRRNRIFDAVANHLRSGSHLVLVVPALESALLTDFRHIQWNLRNGVKPSAAVRAGFRAHRQNDAPRLREGIILTDDVPTKHYLKEELIAILEQRRMTIVDIHKIEYSWKTEFVSPPRWMKTPYPWDWLVVAQKMKPK
jgi:SAM-dependent methyltransferase